MSRPGWRAAWTPAAVVVAVLALSGCAGPRPAGDRPARWVEPAATGAPSRRPATGALPERPTAGTSPGRPAAAGPGAATPAAGPPVQLRLPAIGVDVALESLRLGPGGELAPPRDFARPGWYADGTPPGDVGPAVIAGHVDSWRGPAVFHRLHELRPGDGVEVRRGSRWVRFRVVTTGRYAKDRFPTAEVYGPTPDAQLRLITCGGDFDAARRSYRDNVVVYAVAR